VGEEYRSALSVGNTWLDWGWGGCCCFVGRTAACAYYMELKKTECKRRMDVGGNG
jgi:hypothetical protein